MQQTASAIDIRDLCKTYRGNDAPAVDHFSLTIPEGAIFGLLGPNGAGKTTLVHILCGLRPFNAGQVTVCSLPLRRRLKDIKPLIGVVPQDIALYPTLTAGENLNVFGRILGLRGAVLENRIRELLALFGLEAYRDRRVEHYSGGMKRRLNLIAGLLHRPRILFLDEPTVGVDVQSRRLILDSLKLIRRDGSTIIYTSHYLEEAASLCTQVAFIDRGKLICQGVPAELIRAAEGCDSLETLYLQLTGNKQRDCC
ncbi:MAG: ABC transporter ATP-binding protein [Tannerella sp.]|jgi:ABC-2 type transport system ATP-binding protein|nr:ABC transporter ATP-binding protein [Tannerella sp.]